MSKKQDIEKDINIINPKVYEEKRTINKITWVLPIVTMIFSLLIILVLTYITVYEKEKSELSKEAYVINNVVNDEFSVALNSINLNGYTEIFEQYLKTAGADITSGIYYEDAKKTLDNVTNISDNIITTFVISFQHKALVASGISENAIYNYEYENQGWYDFKKIKQNQMYVSNEFIFDKVSNNKLFAIVRPVVDTMNDEPLGVVAFCYEEDYLQKVFEKAVGNKIEAVIKTDTGKNVLDTLETKNFDITRTKNYLIQRRNNETLNWTVETYMHNLKIVWSSLPIMLVVIILYVFCIYVYMGMVNKLVDIKVIDKKEKIVIEKKEEVMERKFMIEEEELAIEDVLGNASDTEEIINGEEDVIMSGEIIYNKK